MWCTAQYATGGRFNGIWQAPVAAALLLAGLLLMAVAVVSFVRAHTTVNPLRPGNASHLLTSGVFALSRNPIYLGDLLVLAALVAWLGSAWNLLALPLFVACIQALQIAPEERALQQLFGDTYLNYCARVRRWL
ncbi:MAG: hypothetical protein RLZZ401_327 [Pseudomonadota bacterium]|jgi:protein-S-isoprenylcysteine O-methyltransferase Ste14